MDFFETLFGLTPDGGDGTTEAMWIGAVVLAALAIVFRRRIMAGLGGRTALRQK